MRRKKAWQVYPEQPELVAAVMARHNLPRLVARILLNRGLAAADDITAFRAAFAGLAPATAAAVRAFGIPGAVPLHLIRCPMAFDNKGAVWLQRDPQVRNPYFGAAMLRCGLSVARRRQACKRDRTKPFRHTDQFPWPERRPARA